MSRKRNATRLCDPLVYYPFVRSSLRSDDSAERSRFGRALSARSSTFGVAAHAGGEYFVQLSTGHPLLALLIAERRRFGVTADVRHLVDWKRRDLLGLFGVPARPLYARLLARVPPSVKTLPGRITIVQGEGSIARLTSRGPEEGRVTRRFKTYRYSGHSRADPGSYRAASELNHWRDQPGQDLSQSTFGSAG